MLKLQNINVTSPSFKANKPPALLNTLSVLQLCRQLKGISLRGHLTSSQAEIDVAAAVREAWKKAMDIVSG